MNEARRPSSVARGRVRSAVAVLFGIAMVAILARKVATFLVVVPGHDFVGDLAYAELLADSLRQGLVFPDWLAGEAFGRPSTVQRASVLLFLPPALLELVGLSSLTAAKVWTALLHVGSIGPFYVLARSFRVRRGAAMLAALAYAVDPLHLQSFVTSGHWQLAVSFFLAPLLAWAALALVRAPSPPRVALLSLLLAWGVLSDNERTVTLLPVLGLLVSFELRRASRPQDAGIAICSALGLSALVIAAGAWPLVLESRWLTLAGEPSLFASHLAVRFSHPLYVFDGGSLVYGPDTVRPVGAAGIQASFALTLGATAAAAWAASRRGRETPLDVHGPGLGAVLLCVLWLGTARPAWVLSSFSLFPARPVASVLGGVLSLAVAASVLWLAWRRGTRGKRAVVVIAGAILLLVPSGAILSRVPIVSSISNPRWFLQVNLPLVTALLGALGLDAVMGGAASRRASAAALTVVGALGALDALTASTAQSLLEPGLEARARAAADVMRADPVQGRTLPVPYVESDARLAFAQRFAVRPSASSWLLWASPLSTSRLLASLYAELESDDLARARRALETAAAANVRFLVVTARLGVLDSLSAEGLVVDVAGAGGQVLRNVKHTSDVFVTSAGGPLRYERPEPGRIVVPRAPAGTLRVAESYYPYWTAHLAGRRLDVREASGFMEIEVPTGGGIAEDPGQLELRYVRPLTDRIFQVVSALSLAGCFILALKRRGDRDRPG